MKHGNTSRRQRGRGNGGRRGGNQRMQVFDSNGPDVRIRGTAHQVAEKYMALAKDAASSGDDIMAESYLQHAEHYQRMINSWAPAEKETSTETKTEKEKSFNKLHSESQDDDLSLPSSILGGEAKVESETRTAEMSA